LLPMINTGIIGLTAPLIAYRLATSNSMFAWAVAVAWTWWGLVDFTHYLARSTAFP
jgi:hypothetical protein